MSVAKKHSLGISALTSWLVMYERAMTMLTEKFLRIFYQIYQNKYEESGNALEKLIESIL